MRIVIRSGLVLGLLLLFIAHAAEWLRVPLFAQLETFAYDTQVRADAQPGVDPRVVIVDIDEYSINEEGHWPWPRARLAELVKRLYNDYEVFTVGFDMVFAEEGRTPGQEWVEALQRSKLGQVPGLRESIEEFSRGWSGDAAFAEALGMGRSVLGFVLKGSLDNQLKIGVLPESDLPGPDEWPANAYTSNSYTGNIPILQQGRVGGFFNNPALDLDGVFRRVSLLQEHDGRYYPSLALQMVRMASGQSGLELDYGGRQPAPLNLEYLQVGDSYRIPVDESLAILVPYRGLAGSFPYVPAADVLNGTADAEVLKQAIVLIGATAPGLLDLRNTPVGPVYPGVEVHANIIAGILDDRVKSRVPYRLGILVVELLIIAALMHLVFPLLSPIAGTALAFGLGLVVYVIARYAWLSHDFIMPMGLPLAFLLANVLLQVTWSYFVVARSKREIASAFGQYVPPEIVDEIAEHPELMSEAAEKREMTVLFSDVRGFTTISEGLDSTELSELMNEFLTPLTHTIHDQRGTIDKYMGDAIMAFWGAPLPDEDHRKQALEAGLAMLKRIEQIGDVFEAKGWPRLALGVGINTGPMSVGNMGSEFRRAYTVLGDAVNLGSRLEGLTKSYGVAIICADSTRQGMDEWVFRELDKVRVKGKHEPVSIFEPMGPRDDLSKERRKELSAYRKALIAYREQNWLEAEQAFRALQAAEPERLVYQLYLDRIAVFKQEPPGPDWDGVFTHTSK